MKFSEKINQAYLETTYRILTKNFIFDLQIGKTNELFDLWCKSDGVKSWAVITAKNPYSDVKTEVENLMLNELLQIYLNSEEIKYEQALGIPLNKIWKAEESYFLKNIDLERAFFLGRKFHQNAIVYGCENQNAKLIWCAV